MPSDPRPACRGAQTGARSGDRARPRRIEDDRRSGEPPDGEPRRALRRRRRDGIASDIGRCAQPARPACDTRSEEHTSELQSLMRIPYAVFRLKKKNYATPIYFELLNLYSYSFTNDTTL